MTSEMVPADPILAELTATGRDMITSANLFGEPAAAHTGICLSSSMGLIDTCVNGG